jgi:repressor LexA
MIPPSHLAGIRAARHAQIVAATRRAERDRSNDAITPPQTLILNIIGTAIKRDKVPPTVREIATEAGLGTSTTAYHLAELQAKGYLHRNPGKPRALKLTREIGPAAHPSCDHCGCRGIA